MRQLSFLKKTPFLALGLVLVACGKRGDPLPPLRPTPQPVTGLAISQRGKELVVRLVTPRASSDGSRLPVLDLELLRLEGDGDFAKSAQASTRKVAPGERLELTEPLPAIGTALRIAARASHQNRKSVQTPVVSFTVQPELPAPAELIARSSVSGVALSWVAPDPMPCWLTAPPAPAPTPSPALKHPGVSTRPPAPGLGPGGPAPGRPATSAVLPPQTPPQPSGASGATPPSPPADSTPASAAPAAAATPGAIPQPSPAPSAAPEPPLPPQPGGFLVYRRAKSVDYTAALTSQAVEAPHYDDTAASLGDELCYLVRTAISTDPLIESDASNEVCLKVEDVTAPAAPAGVTTLAVENGIEVSWSPSVETDLASYRVQRAVKGAEPERIGEVIVPTTSFRDTTVSRDKRHRYSVTAVDQAGNESPPSAPAEASWP